MEGQGEGPAGSGLGRSSGRLISLTGLGDFWGSRPGGVGSAGGSTVALTVGRRGLGRPGEMR